MYSDGISVVVPTYNRSKIIRRAVMSASYAARKITHEIIIVDDNSDDFHEMVLALEDIKNVRFLQKPERTNAAHSRKIGFDVSQFPLVFFLDSDDEYKENHISRRIHLAESTSAGIIFGNYSIVGPSGKLRDTNFPRYDEFGMRAFLFERGGSFASSTLTVNKKYNLGTIFEPHWRKHQDWAFGIAACDAGENIEFDHECGILMHFDDPKKMSMTVDVAASKQFADVYLKDPAHVGEFFGRQLRVCIKNNDLKNFTLLVDAVDRTRVSFFENVKLTSAKALGALGLFSVLSLLVNVALKVRHRLIESRK